MAKVKEFIVGERRGRVLARLERIEGQVRGLKRMVEEGRYCVEIMTQLSSVHEALRGVGKEVMRNYLESCVTRSIKRGGSPEVYDELMEMIYKYAK